MPANAFIGWKQALAVSLQYYTWIVLAAVAGSALALVARQASGTATAVAVLVFGSWLAYRLSPPRLMDTAGFLKNPPAAALTAFSASTVYYGLNGAALDTVQLYSLGVGLAAGVAGAILFAIYNP